MRENWHKMRKWWKRKKIYWKEKKNLNEIENIIESLMLLGLIRYNLRLKTTNLIDAFFFISNINYIIFIL